MLGVFAAARDVTAQRKAEAEVAEQRAREWSGWPSWNGSRT